MKFGSQIFLFLLILFSGCKIGQTLSVKHVNKNLRVLYGLTYNNRTAKHKPLKIYVSVDTLNTRFRNHSQYTFYINSNMVRKSSNYGGEVQISYLVIDSLNISVKDNLSAISLLEYNLFEKVIYFSDSMNLKDFSYLRKANGFKLTQ